MNVVRAAWRFQRRAARVVRMARPVVSRRRFCAEAAADEEGEADATKPAWLSLEDLEDHELGRYALSDVPEWVTKRKAWMETLETLKLSLETDDVREEKQLRSTIQTAHVILQEAEAFFESLTYHDSR